jgi:RNA polymerase sigma-70 factor (ECF subfamily)
MNTDDRALILRCLAGDKQAFEPLVKRHSGHVFRILHRFFSDRMVIEDIAQEVFLRAYSALKEYRRERPFEHWLAKIAVNMCYQHLRINRTERLRPESDFSAQEISLLQERSCTPFRSGMRDPAESLMLRNTVEKILQHLSAREQMVLILSEVEGMSVQEIAELMGISSIHVKVIKVRGRKRALRILQGLSKQDSD